MYISPEYDWTKEHVQYNTFINGEIKCPYEKRAFNIGYLGEGKYKTTKNGKKTKYYEVWYGMLQRAYDPKYIQKHPTYKGCRVHESWHNFQTFSEWFEKNYYEIKGQRMAIDKDILYKGNKIYSKETCIFVPHLINTLFIKCDTSRGDLPVGVARINKKYMAECNVDKKMKYLGCYDTPEQAFQAYKNFKEKYIKDVAEEYKDQMPTKLYNAMIQYKIEIDD